MRIVIDTDQPDEGQDPRQIAVTQMAGTQSAGTALDGGPAPVALMRRFGRIPEATAETAEAETAGGEAAPGESGEAPPNPLRHGAAAAMERQQSGGPAPTRAAAADEAPAEDRVP
jgi:hypothetical protein